MEKSKEKLTCTKKNEGFKTSGQVQYVAQTGNFKKKGLEYTGALEILKVILSYDYLWFLGCDSDLLSDEMIHQSGFTYVWTSNNRYKSGFKIFVHSVLSFFNN